MHLSLLSAHHFVSVCCVSVCVCAKNVFVGAEVRSAKEESIIIHHNQLLYCSQFLRDGRAADPRRTRCEENHMRMKSDSPARAARGYLPRGGSFEYSDKEVHCITKCI